MRRFPLEDAVVCGGVAAGGAATAPAELVMQVSQEQLRSKDEQMRTLEKQLDRKGDQIASLNEWMRESNVLMRELQQRLVIAAPKPVTAESFVESSDRTESVMPSPSPQPARPSVAKAREKSQKNPKLRGMWSRLFRSSK